MLTNLQLDLFRWESEDADVFKSVQRSLPPTQTWLKEFFCAMEILLLNSEEYDIEGLDERDNPLTGFEINQTNYPVLEEGVQSNFRKRSGSVRYFSESIKAVRGEARRLLSIP